MHNYLKNNDYLYGLTTMPIIGVNVSKPHTTKRNGGVSNMYLSST